MALPRLRSSFLRVALVLVVGTGLGVAAYGYSQGSAPPPTTAVPTTLAAAATPTTTVPTTTTTTTVATTTTTTLPPEPEKGWLVIHGTGDVNLDPDYIPAFRTHGYDHAFAGLQGLFLADDLTVVNLECAPSHLGSPLPKEFTFRCDPQALPVMAGHGVEVANLANNHGQDYGKEAMLDGRANLVAAGIHPVGVGADLEQATQPAVVEVDGWTVAVVGFGGVVPSAEWLAGPDTAGMASGDDLAVITETVRRAAEVADLVVVTIHWGWELETTPRDDDRERAAAMIAAGADAVFGHHQHRLNPMEMVDGRPVFWGLGNFVWPRLSVAGATTGVARVLVSPEGEVSGCLLPAEIVSHGHPVLTGEIPCAPPEGR